jgi:hypothetical protein
MPKFIETIPKTETLWRSIILFGRNVASYKFALGKALLDVADKEKTFIKLEELAEPYSRHLVDHLKISDKQGTSSSSQFLSVCRDYSKNKISKDDLLSKTVTLGFNNVIDAFHMVGKGEVPKRFFIDDRKAKNGITITDDLLKFKENIQFSNFQFEVEARWRLVETAWSLEIAPGLLEVKFDLENNLLFTESNTLRRINITSSRDALNGYQKGKCFFCFRNVLVDPNEMDKLADVDHFFPHALLQVNSRLNLNGIWNLVLSCKECNRGAGGKFASVPDHHLLERLFNRNEFLIQSHHPLRETLVNQTGASLSERTEFLQKIDSLAIGSLIHRWKPKFEDTPAF